MKINIFVEGIHLEKEAIEKVVDFLKRDRGLIEGAWEVAQEPSPFKTPIETPVSVTARVQSPPSTTR